MSLQYIIDGCNIIHHPLFSHTGSKKTTDKRISLLESINQNKLTGSPRNRAIVVFDGFANHELTLGLEAVRADISVIFSGKETADERIRKIVEGSPDNSQTVIVSDDKEIKFLSRIFRAQWQGVEEFLSSAKGPGARRQAVSESGISYVQKERINRELRKLWLK